MHVWMFVCTVFIEADYWIWHFVYFGNVCFYFLSNCKSFKSGSDAICKVSSSNELSNKCGGVKKFNIWSESNIQLCFITQSHSITWLLVKHQVLMSQRLMTSSKNTLRDLPLSCRFPGEGGERLFAPRRQQRRQLSELKQRDWHVLDLLQLHYLHFL